MRLIAAGKGKVDYIHNKATNLFMTKGKKLHTKTINYLNAQKLRINKNMLQFAITEFENKDSEYFQGFNVLKDYNGVDKKYKETREKRIANSKKQETPAQQLEQKKLDKLEQDYEKSFKEIQSHNSKYYLYKNILMLGVIYENVTFYLPTFMDFRGRIYTNPDYLQYQGVDLARSLIEFENGCNITKSNEYVVHLGLANCAGKSRETFNEKCKFSKEFIKKLIDKRKSYNIESLYKEPEVAEIISQNKDESGQLLTILNSILNMKNPKIIRELKKATKELPKFHAPIYFDATANCMEHLSSLFGNIELGKGSNTIGAGDRDEKPNDIYAIIAEKFKKSIETIKDLELREKINKINFTRE